MQQKSWERTSRFLLAFTMAVLLWFYVMGLENPAESAVFPNLPITVRGLTTDLDGRTTLGPATESVTAPKDVLGRTQAGDLRRPGDATGRAPGSGGGAGARAWPGAADKMGAASERHSSLPRRTTKPTEK